MNTNCPIVESAFVFSPQLAASQKITDALAAYPSLAGIGDYVEKPKWMRRSTDGRKLGEARPIIVR